MVWASSDPTGLSDKDLYSVYLDNEVVSKIKASIVSSDGDTFTLIPYGVTPEFEDWASAFKETGRVSIFGETLSWTEGCPNKTFLYRRAAHPDVPSALETAMTGKAGQLQHRRGYICETLEEMSVAHKLLGGAQVTVSPVLSNEEEVLVR